MGLTAGIAATALLAAALAPLGTVHTTGQATGEREEATAVAAPASARLGDKPYLGWSSWSLQATTYPGTNPDGPGSWLNDANVRRQADAMAAKLKAYGYEYINVDAGWQDGADEYGRPKVNTKRFPNGMKSIGDYIHSKGLKFGIYTVVGIGSDAYNGGSTPIYGTTACFTRDIVYPDLRTTNGWDSAYKIDYTNPCAQEYANSIADLFVSWGVDFVKMDGVGPGSFKGGDTYDNRADVAAWSRALRDTGRPILYTISWALSHRYAGDWKRYTNGWRIDTDVECYCDTLVRWDASVKQRWWDVVQWIDDAGPGHWNNLDAVNVGVGAMDGLTDDERRSYLTFWAIQAAPLFAGDDLTKLDPFGLSLLTNREVIAIDQAGRPARPSSQSSLRQVWSSRQADGSYVVALFNLGDQPARVTAKWDELGITGPARIRDVWQGRTVGTSSEEFGAEVPVHGTRLLRVTPLNDELNSPSRPAHVHATGVTDTSVSLAWDASRGARVEYAVYANGKQVARTSGTRATLSGLRPATGYSFTVRAISGGNQSAASATVRLTTPAAGGPSAYEGENGVLGGQATLSDCSACSGGRKVGYLGGSGTLTMNGLRAPADGTYLLRIAYTDGDSSRQGTVTMNGTADGGTAYWVNFHGTGDNDWSSVQEVVVPVELKAGDNTIEFANPGGYMPDIDRVLL
ncbi:fibronectin type III domain-containing protein [Flindersiella endophytica]